MAVIDPFRKLADLLRHSENMAINNLWKEDVFQGIWLTALVTVKCLDRQPL
jgi:hypothetical protein